MNEYSRYYAPARSLISNFIFFFQPDFLNIWTHEDNINSDTFSLAKYQSHLPIITACDRAKIMNLQYSQEFPGYREKKVVTKDYDYNRRQMKDF